MLQTVRDCSHYLANLEWTHRPQDQATCIFCDPARCKSIVKYQNNKIKVVENIHLAGEKHWLIMPIGPHDDRKRNKRKNRNEHETLMKTKRPRRFKKTVEHVRDIENLDASHIGLLLAMKAAKERLIKEECDGVPLSEIHSGYHRGRRPLVGGIFYPDIISIHHLHLHVIVRPRLLPKLFKYPSWLPLMWKSDERVLREVGELHVKTQKAKEQDDKEDKDNEPEHKEPKEEESEEEESEEEEQDQDET